MAESESIESIEQYEKKNGKITLLELLDLKRKTVAAVPRPKMEDGLQICAQPNDEIVIPIDGIPLPDIDLYKGKLVKREAIEHDNRKIIAAFRGDQGPVISNVRYDPEEKVIKLTVPTQARSGVVVLSFPIRFSYKGIKQSSIKKIIEDAKIKDCIDIPLDEDHFSSLKMIAFHYEIRCGKCRTNSICPHGAIKFNINGKCYVDQEICRGQSSNTSLRVVDDRQLNARVDEEICWECLGNNECPATISKVLYIDSGCCGCCIETAQVIEGACLADVCSYNAIESRELPCPRCPDQSPGTNATSYSVDQRDCTGCMDCYQYIHCGKIKMKASIEPPLFGVVTINTIRFRETRVPSSHVRRIAKDWALGLWWEREDRFYHEEIPIDLDDQGKQTIDRLFQVDSNFHIALISKHENRAISPVAARGGALRPSMTTITTESFVHPVATRTAFETEYGNLLIEYQTSDVSPRASVSPV